VRRHTNEYLLWKASKTIPIEVVTLVNNLVVVREGCTPKRLISPVDNDPLQQMSSWPSIKFGVIRSSPLPPVHHADADFAWSSGRRSLFPTSLPLNRSNRELWLLDECRTSSIFSFGHYLEKILIERGHPEYFRMPHCRVAAARPPRLNSAK